MSLQSRLQKFGSMLSSMVIPNLGAFIAWGLLTAVGIALGSDVLKAFIVPMLNYLLPLLIAFAAGRMVYDYRGGVIACVATMGVILGADVTMFIGAMIMGPLAAWVIKKFDQLIDGKVPMGFELLINNFSIGILGSALGVFGYLALAPAITSLTGVLAGGVDFLISKSLLPLTALFIEPAKVVFLNNAIGQGILSPLGAIQLEGLGKSVLFLLESNPGPGMGVLLAYMFFGKGNAKASAYGASVIHFLGGIHEIYFPFVLMNPILILPLIAGGMLGSFLFGLFGVGLVGVASPGSVISIMMMSAMGDQLGILISILASCALTFAIAIPLVKRDKTGDMQLKEAARKMESLKGKKSRVSSVFLDDGSDFDFAGVKRIAYACDAGLGSSAMGAAVLKKQLKQAGLEEISVFHIAVHELPADCQVIVTHQALLERVREIQPDVWHVAISNYLNPPEYPILIEQLKKAKGKG